MAVMLPRLCQPKCVGGFASMPLMLAPLLPCSCFLSFFPFAGLGSCEGVGGEVAVLSSVHALLLAGQGFCEVSFPGCQA